MTPSFTITNASTAALTKIERARGFLEAAKLSQKWLQGMQERAFILEAHHSTQIEGTHLTLAESEKLLAGEVMIGVDPDDARELLNYRDAFELVSDYLGSGEPITEGLLREIHKRLVLGVRGNSAAPGEYRRIQNYVANSITKQIVYTPPPLDVPMQMSEFVAWLQTETGIHPVLVAGIAQFQLVHIHPFLDGNGRTARLLATLCLYRMGYDFKRLFTISQYYDRNRSAYYRVLQEVREHEMDLTAWLEYFANGLATQLGEVQQKGEQLIRQDVLAVRYGLSERQSAVMGLALQTKTFGIQEVAALMPEVTRRTLQRELKGLLERGLLVGRGASRTVSYALSERA